MCEIVRRGSRGRTGSYDVKNTSASSAVTFRFGRRGSRNRREMEWTLFVRVATKAKV